MYSPNSVCVCVWLSPDHYITVPGSVHVFAEWRVCVCVWLSPDHYITVPGSVHVFAEWRVCVVIT